MNTQSNLYLDKFVKRIIDATDINLTPQQWEAVAEILDKVYSDGYYDGNSEATPCN